jgi:hypothetical protein
VIVYFGKLFVNDKNNPNGWATVFYGKGHALFFTKNGFGYIWDYFFTNTSGHPVFWKPSEEKKTLWQ